MPNYEELYNDAKNKYNQAVSEKSSIRTKSGQLQTQKVELERQLSQKRTALSNIQKKQAAVDAVITKVNKIQSEQFPAMKKGLKNASEAYADVLSADSGVANLLNIYDTDITATNNNLNQIHTEMTRILNALNAEEKTAKNEVKKYNDDLNNVKKQINGLGSEAAAQIKIDFYYTEMKTYEVKWLNGE